MCFLMGDALCVLLCALVVAGLQQLLDFDGDVQETFELTFIYEYQAYGETISIELSPGGGQRAGTPAL